MWDSDPIIRWPEFVDANKDFKAYLREEIQGVQDARNSARKLRRFAKTVKSHFAEKAAE